MFDSRIVIKMPEKLTIQPGSTPEIKNLDGKVYGAKISQVTDFLGCVAPIVCYSIEHTNVREIPAGSILRFSILGTTNQVSQQKAGKWEVQTQIKELTTNKHFNIDHGSFTTDWTAIAGGIVTSGTNTKSNNYQNHFKPSVYTFNFNILNYIPKDGFLTLTLPKQVKLISSPFDTFTSNQPNLVKTTEFTEQTFKLKA